MKNQIKTILLLGVLSAILIGFGGMLGRQWVGVFTALALLANFGAYFWSDKLVLRIHRAQPVAEAEAPRLYAIIRELSMRAQIPMPRVYRVPSPQPNAFATGRNPAHGVVAVTDGILQILSERELRRGGAGVRSRRPRDRGRNRRRAGDAELHARIPRRPDRGVLAHEIAHIRNRDILVSTIAAAVAGAIAYIANMLQWTAIFGGSSDDDAPNPVAALALAIIAARSSLSSAEAHVVPPATAAPATASLFIVNPFAGARGLANLFSTHPPMAERIRRLRGMLFARAA